MVSEKQKREIKEHMMRIKEARTEEMGEKVITRRTRALYNYLEQEGIVNQFDE